MSTNTQAKNIPRTRQKNSKGVILEFAVQVQLNQHIYLVSADKQQPGEPPRAAVTWPA